MTAARTTIVNVRAKPMRVSPLAVAQMGRPATFELPFTPAQTFSIPKPAPGVPSAYANDDITNLYSYAQNNLLQHAGTGFFGIPYLSELTQRPEYRRPSEIIAKTMTRKWIKLTATGDEDKTNKLKQLEAAMKRFRLQEMFRRVAEQDGFFGRAHLYVDTGAVDDAELATPLFVHKAKVKKGGLKGFRIVEPLWTSPQDYNTIDPLAADFYRPNTWYVMSRKVHRTRLLTFVGREMPDLLKPAYQFGGLSLSQMGKPYVDNWLRTRQSVSDLLHSFSTMVLNTDLSGILNGGAATELSNRLAFYVATRDNRGVLALDKEREELTNVSTPLGTLDHLQAQSQEQLASVWGIPLVVLLGITPSGLNATAEPEIKVFYDWVHAQQEHLFRTHLTTCLQLIQLNEFGEIDDEIDFEFEQLFQLDEVGLAAVKKTKADTHAVYLQESVVSPEEVRMSLAADDQSDYQGLDLSTPPPEPPAIEGNEDLTDVSESVDKEGSEGSQSGANASV